MAPSIRDRGRADPLYSADLEDISALILCRPSLVEEVRKGDPAVAGYVADQVRNLLSEFDAEDHAAVHLNHAFGPSDAIRLVIERLKALS